MIMSYFMHDCMPRDYYYQAVPRSQINWNGDTWKAFLEIRTDRNSMPTVVMLMKAWA